MNVIMHSLLAMHVINRFGCTSGGTPLRPVAKAVLLETTTAHCKNQPASKKESYTNSRITWSLATKWPTTTRVPLKQSSNLKLLVAPSKFGQTLNTHYHSFSHVATRTVPVFMQTYNIDFHLLYGAVHTCARNPVELSYDWIAWWGWDHDLYFV